jgi:tricarballylate dehydrogenase
MNAPEFGDLAVGDNFQKHSYPWGILVNNRGMRFLDEGADFRNYTYAKYGREMLAQPGLGAWQVFDAKVAHFLRDEYKIQQVTKVKADTLKGLADQMDGMDVEQFVKTIEEYNTSVEDSVTFDPTLKDGRRTKGLAVDKTNWANTISDPPFEAYQVTCGITFTFGGLRVSRNAEVLGGDGNVIPGLFACGELVGGLFYFNYPGGTGLTSGSVFGRIAGRESAMSLA